MNRYVCNECGTIALSNTDACINCGKVSFESIHSDDIKLKDIIAYLRLFDNSALSNQAVCLAYISDLAPHLRSELVILEMAYECGVVDVVAEGNPGKNDIALALAIMQEHSFSDSATETILGAFCETDYRTLLEEQDRSAPRDLSHVAIKALAVVEKPPSISLKEGVGDTHGLLLEGLEYYYGENGRTESFVEAAKCFNKVIAESSLEQDVALAQSKLAILYSIENGPFGRDLNKACELFENCVSAINEGEQRGIAQFWYAKTLEERCSEQALELRSKMLAAKDSRGQHRGSRPSGWQDLARIHDLVSELYQQSLNYIVDNKLRVEAMEFLSEYNLHPTPLEYRGGAASLGNCWFYMPLNESVGFVENEWLLKRSEAEGVRYLHAIAGDANNQEESRRCALTALGYRAFNLNEVEESARYLYQAAALNCECEGAIRRTLDSVEEGFCCDEYERLRRLLKAFESLLYLSEKEVGVEQYCLELLQRLISGRFVGSEVYASSFYSLYLERVESVQSSLTSDESIGRVEIRLGIVFGRRAPGVKTSFFKSRRYLREGRALAPSESGMAAFKAPDRIITLQDDTVWIQLSKTCIQDKAFVFAVRSGGGLVACKPVEAKVYQHFYKDESEYFADVTDNIVNGAVGDLASWHILSRLVPAVYIESCKIINLESLVPSETMDS